MFYRIVVMGMVVAVAGMAWKVYGPPLDTAIDWAQETMAVAQQMIVLGNSAESPKPIQVSAEPSAMGPTYGRPIHNHPDTHVQPASVSLTSPEPPIMPPAIASGPAGTGAPAQPPSNPRATTGQLLAQLTGQGMTEHRLERWGSEGQLYRFSCQVAPADNPLYARHFEAVAADGESAVTRVASEVAAWLGEMAGNR
jgi:hypothetical protein